MDKLTIIEDKRGCLMPFEMINMPFKIRRQFVVSNVPKGTVRGGHAHKKCEQYIICLNGSIKVHIDTLQENQTVTLNTGDCIYVGILEWSEQTFLEDNSMILVLCSKRYKVEDYIYEKEFLQIEIDKFKEKYGN